MSGCELEAKSSIMNAFEVLHAAAGEIFEVSLGSKNYFLSWRATERVKNQQHNDDPDKGCNDGGSDGS
jgi:hypothetical protein